LGITRHESGKIGVLRACQTVWGRRNLNAFELVSAVRAGIGRWIDYYNADRPHSAFGGRTPIETHQGISGGIGLAA
jgi:transposase InsO family protein